MMSPSDTKVQYINANGTQLAYKRLGSSSGTPLLMAIHFRANMTLWDPLLITELAKQRPVILFDLAGIGRSSGVVPTSMPEWAGHLIALVQALGIPQIDLLGFSMSGLAVQYVALNAPKGMIRKLILCGTRTSQHENTVVGDRKWFIPLATSESEEDFKKSWVDSFFPPTREGQDAGYEVWARIASQQDRSPHLSTELAKRQIRALESTGGELDKTPAHKRLGELDMPVLIANGDDDLLIPSINSWELLSLIKNAQLIIYPNSGHGFLYQYAELFAEHVRLFLDGPKSKL